MVSANWSTSLDCSIGAVVADGEGAVVVTVTLEPAEVAWQPTRLSATAVPHAESVNLVMPINIA
jgi:hypothetical protein